MDEMGKQYIKDKGYTVAEIWACEWWKLYKTDVSVKENLRDLSPEKCLLRQHQLLDKLKGGGLFCYVQCVIKVPEHLKVQLANFPIAFKNANVCR